MRIPLFGKKNMDSATDPVCGMDVDISSPRGGTAEYNGEKYYFCASGCREAFAIEPDSYLSGEKRIEM